MNLSKLLRKLRIEGSSSLSMVEKLKLDSPHKALNYLLQSGAGVVAKRWMVINQETQIYHKCASQLFIHDELQFECSPELDINILGIQQLQQLENTTNLEESTNPTKVRGQRLMFITTCWYLRYCRS